MTDTMGGLEFEHVGVTREQDSVNHLPSYLNIPGFYFHCLLIFPYILNDINSSKLFPFSIP